MFSWSTATLLHRRPHKGSHKSPYITPYFAANTWHRRNQIQFCSSSSPHAFTFANAECMELSASLFYHEGVLFSPRFSGAAAVCFFLLWKQVKGGISSTGWVRSWIHVMHASIARVWEKWKKLRFFSDCRWRLSTSMATFPQLHDVCLARMHQSIQLHGIFSPRVIPVCLHSFSLQELHLIAVSPSCSILVIARFCAAVWRPHVTKGRCVSGG